MRPCTAAGIANITDNISSFNPHSLFYGHFGQMGKTGSQTTAMINFYKITIL